MRQSRRGLLALGLAAAMFALPACSSSANDNGSGSGSGGDKQVEVFSLQALGKGDPEQAGSLGHLRDGPPGFCTRVSPRMAAWHRRSGKR